eukprot:CAMPEP_0118864376 /NCGR_PEP_ID=MMETSP1163-20130328/8979_1 /TAXON_ID=124430 /ORGANISM="Phaeomonas parva, Strain CCMP2877" /LENGTH=32 /DNA_ID= /DNA_START= /DNA_END= /DNA_ORIENTATION=
MNVKGRGQRQVVTRVPRVRQRLRVALALDALA